MASRAGLFKVVKREIKNNTGLNAHQLQDYFVSRRFSCYILAIDWELSKSDLTSFPSVNLFQSVNFDWPSNKIK